MLVDIGTLKKNPLFKSMDDAELKMMVQGLEDNLRRYTNNRFLYHPCTSLCTIQSGAVHNLHPCIKPGDSVEVEDPETGCIGIYTVTDSCGLDPETPDGISVKVTLIRYPIAVKAGCINLLKWDVSNRDKIGIKSETLSRHSVTYFDMEAGSTLLGYPKSLLGFLKPYMRARF